MLHPLHHCNYCHSLLTLLHCVGLASISCDRSDQLSGHSHLTLPGLLSRRLLPVVWTGVTRSYMVCRRTCWGRCSQCRMLPLVYSPAHADVTTSHHCCVNYTGCQFRDEWSLRLLVLYTSQCHLHRPTWLLTFISSPSMVIALCAHLLIRH